MTTLQNFPNNSENKHCICCSGRSATLCIFLIFKLVCTAAHMPENTVSSKRQFPLKSALVSLSTWVLLSGCQTLHLDASLKSDMQVWFCLFGMLMKGWFLDCLDPVCQSPQTQWPGDSGILFYDNWRWNLLNICKFDQKL